MNLFRISVLAGAALTTGLVAVGQAGNVVGKKPKSAPCATVWSVGAEGDLPAGNKPFKIDCPDGDPRCDFDGEENDSCTIPIDVCVLRATDGCTPPASVDEISCKGKGCRAISGLVLPTVPATEETCGTPGTAVATVKVKRNGKKKPGKPVKATLKSKGAAGKGVNKLIARCLPAGVEGLCPVRSEGPGFPRQVHLETPAGALTDLDTGWTGNSMNFPVITGSTLDLCLSNCDATTDPECDANGPVGEGTVNGPTFGPPLPLLASGVPTCIVNEYRQDVVGTWNLQTGTTDNVQVNLLSNVHLTAATEVCPRCSGSGLGATGKCSSSARNPGAACVVEGTIRVENAAGDKNYSLSGACLPSTPAIGKLNIDLPLTTGERTLAGPTPCNEGVGSPVQDDSCAGTCEPGICSGNACFQNVNGQCVDIKGGISQNCCSDNTATPCQPTAGGGTIVRNGIPSVPSPAWPDTTYPKTQEGVVVGATFCIAATDSALVNGVTGLPGPGAILIPYTGTVTAQE